MPAIALRVTWAEEKAPVYIHTGPPGNATPWQVVDLADRYPSVDLIMGHCGATDFWNDVVVAAKASDNVYLESSLARPFGFVRRFKQVERYKGIMGSFAPINALTFEWEQMRKVLPRAMWEDVCGGNLLRLLEKRGALSTTPSRSRRLASKLRRSSEYLGFGIIA